MGTNLTVLQELEKLFTTDAEKQALAEYLAAEIKNPGVGDDEAQKAAAKAAADKAAADAAAKVAADAEAARKAAVSSTPVDLSAITKQLSDLSASLDDRFKKLDERYVAADKLPAYRGEMLETTIRNAHQAMQIQLAHEKEFPNEPFDLNKVNEFLNEEGKKGHKYQDLKSAYDAMVGEKRVEARIAKGIAEGMKQKKSAESVPGQSGPSGLSPAQEAIKKARGEGGENNLTDISAKLRAIREAREQREAGTGTEN